MEVSLRVRRISSWLEIFEDEQHKPPSETFGVLAEVGVLFSKQYVASIQVMQI